LRRSEQPTQFVIPGCAIEKKLTRSVNFCSGGAGPESITTGWEYGFRAHRFAMSRNDDGELRIDHADVSDCGRAAALFRQVLFSSHLL
jgi:hypothetical protein